MLMHENVDGACKSHGKYETFINYFRIKLEGKRQFGRSCRKWERNITMESLWQVMTENEEELLWKTIRPLRVHNSQEILTILEFINFEEIPDATVLLSYLHVGFVCQFFPSAKTLQCISPGPAGAASQSTSLLCQTTATHNYLYTVWHIHRTCSLCPEKIKRVQLANQYSPYLITWCLGRRV